MFILIHIVIAFTSIIIATLTLLNPSFRKLVIGYGFIVATGGTGAVLLITIPSQILHTCVAGITYLTVVSIMTIAAQVRLRRKELASTTL